MFFYKGHILFILWSVTENSIGSYILSRCRLSHRLNNCREPSSALFQLFSLKYPKSNFLTQLDTHMYKARCSRRHLPPYILGQTYFSLENKQLSIYSSFNRI